MSTLNGQKAVQEINKILSGLGTRPTNLPGTAHLGVGKLYELYVLSCLLGELASIGYTSVFSGPLIAFKTSGGPIKAGDFHVDLYWDTKIVGQLYTDVEVMTLGWAIGTVNDLSRYHEMDVVIVKPGTIGYPTHEDVLLGVECKATAKFAKSHVREALGRRRELSYLSAPQPSAFFPHKVVHANPPSEYWLAFIDPAGLKYSDSPKVFSVELKHWQP